MDCKTTSIKIRSAGANLVEMMVATGVLSLVFIAIASISYFSGRSFAAMANYVDLDYNSRKALDRMSKEIRQVNYLMEASDNWLVFKDSDGGTLVYYYAPGSKKLMRVKSGKSETLLQECDYLKFSIFQRNPVGGTYNQYPTAVPANCKLVQLNWTCSRQIFGKKANTESVQSAKIVIRKE